jgi:hypothetical protein
MRGWGLLEVSMTHLAKSGLAGHAPSRRDHRPSPQQVHVDYHPSILHDLIRTDNSIECSNIIATLGHVHISNQERS